MHPPDKPSPGLAGRHYLTKLELNALYYPRHYRIVTGPIRQEAGDIPFFSRLTQRIERRGLQTVFQLIPVQ